MIYTVTFNPSLDYVVSVEDFRLGRTNRSQSEQLLPGGKGINVSIVLKNLGVESTALGFVAGFTGEELARQLGQMGVQSGFIPLAEGCTRINLKLKSIEGTEINGQGPRIGEEKVERLMAQLEELSCGDVLFLAGSIPASMSADTYQRIMERLRGKGVQIVVDAAKELLMNVLPYHPFLIKPNHQELGEIFGVEFSSRRDVVPYGKRLQKQGARNVLISMAGEGAVLLAEDGKVYEAPAPEGTLVNGVGAGDSMVAGFMAGWLKKQDYRFAFHMGVAAGSASAFSEYLATGEEIETVYRQVAKAKNETVYRQMPEAGTEVFCGKTADVENETVCRKTAGTEAEEHRKGRCYQGKSICGGIAIGKIHVYKKNLPQVNPLKTEDSQREITRYRQAKEAGIRQLEKLYETALESAGEEGAAIFKGHQMILMDEEYNEAVEQIILSRKVNAEYAVAAAGDDFARKVAAVEDDYMRERAEDVKDISRQLLDILGGKEPDGPDAVEPAIVVAGDLTPSETVQLDKDRVLAFVMVGGSANSHTAVLARTLDIPALAGTPLSLDDNLEGRTGIVDGGAGRLYVEPDENTLAEFTRRQQEELEKKKGLMSLKGRENVTLDGRKIMLYANIGSLEELDAAIQNDAGGIGLFRSEFIFMERDRYPAEEEQFQIYRQAAEKMAGKPVVIRTLDLGADKQCDYLKMDQEENPALGLRGIRISLTRPELFRTQIRALLRASVFGNIKIMYPMISSLKEIKQIRELVSQTEEELTRQGIPWGRPKQGIMIETPAAALISDVLAGEVDFFSIGTNDLTQYTLAMDRRNAGLEEFYDPHHPAVLRMISMVVENAHRAGIRAGICGELGADPALTREFLAMGVDELSVPPGSILPLREIVRKTE